jgi:hypothetical protein
MRHRADRDRSRRDLARLRDARLGEMRRRACVCRAAWSSCIAVSLIVATSSRSASIA